MERETGADMAPGIGDEKMNIFDVNEYEHWSSMLSVLKTVDHETDTSRALMEYTLTDLWLEIRVRAYGDDGRIRAMIDYVMFYGEQGSMFPIRKFDSIADLLMPYTIRYGSTGRVLTEENKLTLSDYLCVCTHEIGKPHGFDIPACLVGCNPTDEDRARALFFELNHIAKRVK